MRTIVQIDEKLLKQIYETDGQESKDLFVE